MIECNSRLVSVDFSCVILDHFINSFGITYSFLLKCRVNDSKNALYSCVFLCLNRSPNEWDGKYPLFDGIADCSKELSNLSFDCYFVES